MKKLLFLFGLMLLSLFLFAQAPQSFKYQAVIRYSDGSIVQNQMVDIRLAVLAGSPSGDVVYSETHGITTNQMGIANINVGDGYVILGDFSTINWGENTYYLRTELDLNNTGNFEFIGTSQLLSVPYALYAANAVNVDDEDADPTNEIQIIDLTGNILTLSNGGQVDLSPYMDNTDNQTISLDGTNLSISNGNEIELSGEVDLDSDPTNELQYLSISEDTIYLSDGSFVKLPQVFYDDIVNTPDFSNWDQNVNDDFTGDYNDLQNTPQTIHEFDLDAGNNTVYNVHNPENPQDAATKAYVDDLIELISNSGIGLIEADFSVDFIAVSPDDTVSFTDNSTNAQTWEWDFGDGNTSGNPNPTHVYDQTGIYTIKLTVTNQIGVDSLIKEDLISVITGVEGCPAYVTDFDGNEYETVQIGDQCWMKENLRVLSNASGEPLQMGNSEFLSDYSYSTSNYLIYNNNATNEIEKYGVLYTPQAAEFGFSSGTSIQQGICPDGWHIPHVNDWEELRDHLINNGYNWDGTTSGNKIGKALASKSGWLSNDAEGNVGYNQISNNASGFTGKPGGVFTSGFNHINVEAGWWTTEGNSGSNTDGYYWRLTIYNDDFTKMGANYPEFHSIRCVKD